MAAIDVNAMLPIVVSIKMERVPIAKNRGPRREHINGIKNMEMHVMVLREESTFATVSAYSISYRSHGLHNPHAKCACFEISWNWLSKGHNQKIHLLKEAFSVISKTSRLALARLFNPF